VDLFVGGMGFFVKDVACRLVSKVENASAAALSALSIKRVGVKFEELTIPQQVQINQLVKKHYMKKY
jgi:hypothetical protein